MPIPLDLHGRRKVGAIMSAFHSPVVDTVWADGPQPDPSADGGNTAWVGGQEGPTGVPMSSAEDAIERSELETLKEEVASLRKRLSKGANPMKKAARPSK